jgi:hypothetical protein
MKKLAKLFFFFGKMWALACLLLVGSQIRAGGNTLLNQVTDYCNGPKTAKHFAQLLYPIHWALDKMGVNVGWDKIETAIAFTQTNQEKIKDTFGNDTAEKMEKIKKAAAERKAALDAIEQDLSE